jgi:hypothetical protein
MNEPIYLDFNATTPVHGFVVVTRLARIAKALVSVQLSPRSPEAEGIGRTVVSSLDN